MTAQDARRKLKSLASPATAKVSATFFKTGAGQYGEGDIFIGIKIPVLRQVAREFKGLSLTEIDSLLQSPIHEERMLALLILVNSVERGDDAYHKQAFDFYSSRTQYVNNWDLVDTSAPAIVGGYLIGRTRKPLLKWAQSKVLWERRIAIVATQYFIRRDDFTDTLTISKLLLGDSEDLLHKATGWMLREVGKRHQPTLVEFLNQHSSTMPRTMLRYAIERFPAIERQAYLSGAKP